MANINESIKQLTASLQELAQDSYGHAQQAEPLSTVKVSVQDLSVSKDVELFIERASAYAQKTKGVSIGNY